MSLHDEVMTTLRTIAPEIDPAAVDRARPLTEQLDLDSMDYQNLLAALSDQFAIEIAAADVPKLRSIDDLARYVETHRTRAP
jgi:acyl carrier protein